MLQSWGWGRFLPPGSWVLAPPKAEVPRAPHLEAAEEQVAWPGWGGSGSAEEASEGLPAWAVGMAGPA